VNVAPDEHDERARLLALVRRFGWNATSFQVLEPGYRYFFADADACVAYVDTGRAWVAAGAPLAAKARFAEVAAAFCGAARAAGRRACFFATEDRFTTRVPLRALLVGEQPVWEPAFWDAVLRESPSLREQLRRARAKGVRVRAIEIEAHPPGAARAPLHDAMANVIMRWEKTRELAPLGFLARVDPLALLPDRRLFVAERAGAPVGLLAVAPIYGRNGWLVQNLLRGPDAPNGTSEVLFDFAMREARACGCALVTLGLAPLAGRVPPPLRLARRAGSSLYDFEGLHAFKAKLRPSRWDAAYLSFPEETAAARAILDVLAAFAHRGLLRFGLATLARGPRVMVSLLAVLLVPWTLLLACSDGARWFPDRAVKWGWVVFDAAIAAALFALHRRWRPGLAQFVVAAVAVDAVLTAIEGIGWNLPREPGAAARMVVVVAMLAPILATFVLAAALRRRQGAWGSSGHDSRGTGGTDGGSGKGSGQNSPPPQKPEPPLLTNPSLNDGQCVGCAPLPQKSS